MFPLQQMVAELLCLPVRHRHCHRHCPVSLQCLHWISLFPRQPDFDIYLEHKFFALHSLIHLFGSIQIKTYNEGKKTDSKDVLSWESSALSQSLSSPLLNEMSFHLKDVKNKRSLNRNASIKEISLFYSLYLIGSDNNRKYCRHWTVPLEQFSAILVDAKILGRKVTTANFFCATVVWVFWRWPIRKPLFIERFGLLTLADPVIVLRQLFIWKSAIHE